MKKYLSFFIFTLLMTGMVACGPGNEPTPPDGEENERPEFLDSTKTSTMQVFVGSFLLNADTTIVVTDAEQSLSGAMQMGVQGAIQGVKQFRVTITRSKEDRKDELCAGVQCVPGDGELTQEIDFNLMGETSGQWYTHYTPTEKGDYTVDYLFQNYNKKVKLTVVYRYNG